jgi:hypothetical protein
MEQRWKSEGIKNKVVVQCCVNLKRELGTATAI